MTHSVVDGDLLAQNESMLMGMPEGTKEDRGEQTTPNSNPGDHCCFLSNTHTTSTHCPSAQNYVRKDTLPDVSFSKLVSPMRSSRTRGIAEVRFMNQCPERDTASTLVRIFISQDTCRGYRVLFESTFALVEETTKQRPRFQVIHGVGIAAVVMDTYAKLYFGFADFLSGIAPEHDDGEILMRHMTIFNHSLFERSVEEALSHIGELGNEHRLDILSCLSRVSPIGLNTRDATGFDVVLPKDARHCAGLSLNRLKMKRIPTTWVYFSTCQALLSSSTSWLPSRDPSKLTAKISKRIDRSRPVKCLADRFEYNDTEYDDTEDDDPEDEEARNKDREATEFTEFMRQMNSYGHDFPYGPPSAVHPGNRVQPRSRSRSPRASAAPIRVRPDAVAKLSQDAEKENAEAELLEAQLRRLKAEKALEVFRNENRRALEGPMSPNKRARYSTSSLGSF
ncbi:Uncharacterized protein PECH_005158 [Penicillium ucsense]|uniref:Uncharacterized protein n=1 Tax=Penicillium ucsense TaxID=2839758 RepID=A0A8J8W530_9EURO|nr:Uncharacterized protein PECM_005431 [Penicillium ucsense]KAF7736534.1 Uncharacterized protein PECH_005158 [Penicillium ucsense]